MRIWYNYSKAQLYLWKKNKISFYICLYCYCNKLNKFCSCKTTSICHLLKMNSEDKPLVGLMRLDQGDGRIVFLLLALGKNQSPCLCGFWNSLTSVAYDPVSLSKPSRSGHIFLMLLFLCSAFLLSFHELGDDTSSTQMTQYNSRF